MTKFFLLYSKNICILRVIFVRTNEFSLKNFSIETVYFREFFSQIFAAKKTPRYQGVVNFTNFPILSRPLSNGFCLYSKYL
jgi:hypothetical protein